MLRLYRVSWALALGICICHVLSLTLVINFDGDWYVNLADMLGTNRFPAQWDFLRGPLFPAFLKLVFWLFGRQALAVIGLQVCLAGAGIYLLASRLRTINRPIQASVCVLLLSAYPTLIAYEHALLTEVGTFFFLSLLVYALTDRNQNILRGAFCVAIVIAAGYYFRSSLLYLAPLAGIIYVLPIVRSMWTERRDGDRLLRHALVAFLTITAVPFLLAYPWQRNPLVSTRTGQAVLLFGLVKSSVLPPDDPILDSATSAIYRKAIEDSRSHGRFPANGLQNGWEWSVIGPIYNDGSSASSIFIRIVRTHPVRYFRGVARNILLLSGFSGFHYDNALLRTSVLSHGGGKIDRGPPWFPPLGEEFRRDETTSFTARALEIASPFYDWLVLFGFVATLIAFVVGVWRLDGTVLAFTAIPLAFMLLHACLLMSQDRMALPTYPLFLTNLIMLPAYLKPKARC